MQVDSPKGIREAQRLMIFLVSTGYNMGELSLQGL